MGNRLENYKDDDILYVLTTDDLVGVYDDNAGEGSWESLPDEEKVSLRYLTQRGLENGLEWYDVMDVAIDMAIRQNARSADDE